VLAEGRFGLGKGRRKANEQEVQWFLPLQSQRIPSVLLHIFLLRQRYALIDYHGHYANHMLYGKYFFIEDLVGLGRYFGIGRGDYMAVFLAQALGIVLIDFPGERGMGAVVGRVRDVR
jgi:hypothetical protein